MNRQKWLLLLVAVALMIGTAGILNRLRTNQKLGVPGIKTTRVPGQVVMNIDLPERVLDFTSERVPEDKTTSDTLPKDTSYVQRRYTAADGVWASLSVILMGKDRTSIHKPEFCLSGQGWHIDEKTEVKIPVEGKQPYELSVAKWVMSKTVQMPDGRPQQLRGLYLFWFVADQEETITHWQRVWWLARDLLRTGVLQRWAYVSCFTVCIPGQEEAVFERVKRLIAASVPEFQLPPKSAEVAAMAKP